MNTEMKLKFKEVADWLVKEYAGIRSGQASPAILDSIRVESYGTFMSIQQVGSIGIEDIRTLRVVPWDSGQVVAIEKAIRDANIGVSVVTDSSGLRVIFPELTSERRGQLLKLAKSKLEDARISVRSIRDDEMKEIERQFKANEIGEDDKFTLKESVQKAVEETNNTLEGLFVNKEVELQK